MRTSNYVPLAELVHGTPIMHCLKTTRHKFLLLKLTQYKTVYWAIHDWKFVYTRLFFIYMWGYTCSWRCWTPAGKINTLVAHPAYYILWLATNIMGLLYTVHPYIIEPLLPASPRNCVHPSLVSGSDWSLPMLTIVLHPVIFVLAHPATCCLSQRFIFHTHDNWGS